VRRALACTCWAALAGLALGVLTNVLQGVLPGSFNAFANAGSVWAVAAFVSGALVVRSKRLVIVVGAASQAGAVVGYYAFAQFARSGAGDLKAPLVWLAIGLVAGPIFGIAGAWWRDGTQTVRSIGAGVLGAVFGMDALWHWVVLDDAASAVGFLAVAGLAPVVLGRSSRERWLGLVTTVVLSPVAFGAYYALGKATGLA
jgi:hypothetical protein